MPADPPPFPRDRPDHFRTTVHGTVFGGRDLLIDGIEDGDTLRLIADPPADEGTPQVWVHLQSGEPIGHLPPEIGQWLWPWMNAGGDASALAIRVRGHDVPSWRRLVLEVSCRIS